MDTAGLRGLRDQAERELRDNILPFWRTRAVDTVHGGFYGHMAHDGTPGPAAPKGLVLCARLLWAFSLGLRRMCGKDLEAAAERARTYLLDKHRDPVHGGYVWTVDTQGRALSTRKQIYGQAFVVYALAEHHRATGDNRSRAIALQTAELIERHSHDAERLGYLEAFTREWRPVEDQRLSDVDMNEKKSNNTHLHILEAYTSLALIDTAPWIRDRLRELIVLFLERIVDPATGHLLLFFDLDWMPKTRDVSFGHDVECSWLLCEAAAVVGDPALTRRVEEASMRLAQVTLTQGMDTDGGLFYHVDSTGIVNRDKEWWPQAEAVVGFLNAYELTHKEAYLDAAVRCWGFIQDNLVDHVGGEWHGRVRDGRVDTTYPKVSMWKCPYHNTRACAEIVGRIDRLL